MVQVTLGLDVMITLLHSEHVKVRRLRKVSGVTMLFTAGSWNGCNKSEFGMVVVAGMWQQIHICRPCLRRYLDAAQG